MSTILGILYKKESRIKYESIEYLIQRLSYWKPDERISWNSDDIVLENLLLNTTMQSHNEHKTRFYSESDCIIISDSRLDYRQELVIEIGGDWDKYKSFPDNYLILKSYLKWGEECVKYLFGDFAFAIWNGKNKSLFCARDHFGIRPLYFCDQQDFFIFSSDFMAFKDVPGIKLQITDEYILDSICTSVADRHSSAYANIYKLEPAHYIKVDISRTAQIFNYWELSVKKGLNDLDESSAISGLRERFIECVSSRLSSNVSTGIELSGGLDSSSIASCFSQLPVISDRPFCAFTHTMSSNQKYKPYDYSNVYGLCKEVFKSDPLLKLHGVSGEGLPTVKSAIINYLKIVQKPINQGFASMSDLLYDEAQKQNVRILFSGYGGDQGVTQNGAFYLKELASQRNWSKLNYELKKEVKGNIYNFLKRKINYFLSTYFPNVRALIGQLTLFPQDFYNNRLDIVAVNRKFAKNLDYRNRFLKSIKRPDFQTSREQQYYKITKSNFISERLENSYYSARERRIEYRYPFLDVKLIEYFYSLRPGLKFKDGMNRYLFRMAMEGILDDRIRMIPSKIGSAIPNTTQRLMESEEWLKEIIREGESKNSFHYVNYNQLLWMIEVLKDAKVKKEKKIPSLVFLSGFSVVLLQKWQREGKIDIGIKC